MAASTPRGINYPTSDDKIKDGSSPSALADDFAVLASSSDAAITAGVQEAKDAAALDATAKADDAKWQRSLITDANTVTRAGTFPTGSSTANTPRAEGGELDHYHVSGGWEQGQHMQVWQSQLYAVHRYWRRKSVGLWEPWSQIPEKGDKGSTGAAGATGPTGPGLNLTIGTVTTGQPGTAASALVRDVTGGQELDLTIPTGLPGTGTVEADGAVATYASSPGAQTHDYLHGEFTSLTRERREALADQAVAWASSRIINDRGDSYPAGLCRRVRLRKTTPESTVVIDRDTTGEEPNMTAAALTLRFLAEYAKTWPHKAGAVRPLAEEIGGWIMGMQVINPASTRYGGIKLGPGDQSCGALTAGQAGQALIAGSTVFGVGEWLGAALRVGEFCRTLLNPNARFQALHGVDVIDTIDPVIIDAINGSGQAEITGTGWNLVVPQFMKHLSDVTGDMGYWSDAVAGRDFMATAVTGHHDFYATKGAASGIAAGLVKTNWSNQSSLDLQDNAWHRQGDAAGGNGTIGTDPQEYGLVALWETGYDNATLRTAYDWMISLPNANPETTFGAAYDSRVCFTGYFRVDSPLYGGASKAFGTYYDSQGAGELLAWKQANYPDHYAASLPIINAVLEPDAGALLDENLGTVWSTDAYGAFATQGVIPIMVAATALCLTTPAYDKEVIE